MSSLAVVEGSIPLLARAALTTLVMAGGGILIGLVLGVIVVAGRLSGRPIIAFAATLYVSFFRGVPLLVQLLVVYYTLPGIGIDVPPWAAAIVTLGICSAAYVAEILRGGILAVPTGQREAARIAGLGTFATQRHIVLPQAVRLTVPALVNELILLLKASSLISVVGVTELTRTAQNIAASTFRPLEVYLAAGAFYLVLNLALAAAGGALEHRLREG